MITSSHRGSLNHILVFVRLPEDSSDSSHSDSDSSHHDSSDSSHHDSSDSDTGPDAAVDVEVPGLGGVTIEVDVGGGGVELDVEGGKEDEDDEEEEEFEGELSEVCCCGCMARYVCSQPAVMMQDSVIVSS